MSSGEGADALLEHRRCSGEGGYSDVATLGDIRLFYGRNGGGETPQSVDYHHHAEVPDYVVTLIRSFSDAFSRFVALGLKNPLQEGIYFDKGARYIDVMLTDIPVQKGLVAAELVDNSHLLPGSGGGSIRILLHRNLIENSATPIHELFHVFQYNYCFFNNMWFMEGLARWSQNLTHQRPQKEYPLPHDRHGLEQLLLLAHEAEYFWRHLIALSGMGATFVPTLLAACEEQAQALVELYAPFSGYTTLGWQKEERKASVNQRYLFAAIVQTLQSAAPPQGEELGGFIQCLQQFISDFDALWQQATVPKLLSLLVAQGIPAASYDPLSQTLSYPKVQLRQVTEEDLSHFSLVSVIDGDLQLESDALQTIKGMNRLQRVNSLTLSNMKNLVEITGFNGLSEMQNLEIGNNPKLESIRGFFRFFAGSKRLNGALKIISNKRLTSVSFLSGLEATASSLYLHHNGLTSLSGLESLQEVGASLSLSSNSLVNLEPLASLHTVQGMVGVAFNNLVSLEGLEKLTAIGVTRWGTQYRSLAIQGNPQLQDLRALSGAVSLTGYSIIYLDRDHDYPLLPPPESPFYRQRIACYCDQDEVNTERVFPGYTPQQQLGVVFYDTWNMALSQHQWLNARFHAYNSVPSLVDFCQRHGIHYLYGQVYNAQKFLFQHQDALRAAGLCFLVNDFEIIRLLLNKRTFFEHMLAHELGDYIPRYFRTVEEIEYPCVIKQVTAANGETVRIVRHQQDLGTVAEDEVVNAYVVGSEEYASNIFYRDGEIIFDVTYRKRYSESFYVLNSETKYKMENERIANPFPEVMKQMLDSLYPRGGTLLCCIDYKVEAGVPKIFEINVRLGYTLARDTAPFREMMDYYIREVERLRG
ncbi:MAG: hypothetical protein HQL48_00740 [Gammaproteobacteria bacterium]|nr:hypothetical protein [Gammaproteobacteria bacterium]